MDDALGVRLRQRVGDLRRVLQRVRERQPPAADPVGERRALDVLHGDEVDAVRLADVVDRDDVGMVQRRGRPGFLHEAPPALRVGDLVRAQDLERDQPVETAVAGLVETPIPPSPSFARIS